jgi:cobalt-zinc-cadmium efflux system protein
MNDESHNHGKKDHHHHDHHHKITNRPCGGRESADYSNHKEYKISERKKLLISMAITFVVMIVEIVGGFLSNSIALLSDAGHMFTHFFALGISYIAIFLASMKPSYYRTFGLYRAEVIASLVNSIFLFIVTIVIIYESIIRLINPEPVQSMEMFVIASIGLGVNLLTIWILEGSNKEDRNIRSAVMHMVADALSSVAVVAGAVVIYFTGRTFVDPLLGMLISVLIVMWAWHLFADSIRVLLEIAPRHMSSNEIRQLLKENDSRIKAITDMHVVEITSGMYNFSAHVEIRGESLSEANEVINEINCLLKSKYSIDHTTIQITQVK